MASIRRKIVVGYALLAAGVAVFALLAVADLRLLERRIEEGSAVDDFQETALEMRRHEKNHFLYGGRPELDEAWRLAGDLQQRLGERRPMFAAFATAGELVALGQAVERYRELAGRRRNEAGGDDDTAAAIRAAGREVSQAAERMAKGERAALTATLQQSQETLFLAIGVVVLLGLLGGQLLSRVAVRPLRRLEDQLKPIAEGRFVHLPGVSSDQEMVSLTAALNRMLDELESRRRQALRSEKLASIGVLASGVAHELNNPLGNISSSCQILIEEMDVTDRATLRQWLGQIDDETRRAQAIVRTLLDYARQRDFAAAPVDLAQVVGKSLLLLGGRLKAVTPEVHIPSGLAILGDGQRLQQVFINLVQNAVDAGAGRIEIGARPAAADNWRPGPGACVMGEAPAAGEGGVAVWVADDGPGIGADSLARVFDPFFTTREPGQGVGLGLFVVAEIVAGHGGCIAAESPAGGGARFTAWLPAAGGGS
jgi:signal transduction histidine kinase